MKIKALKSFKGKEGFFYKGHIKEVHDNYAKALIDRNLAEKVVETKEDDIVDVKVDTPEETKETKEQKEQKEEVVEIKVDVPKETKEDKKKDKK